MHQRNENSNLGLTESAHDHKLNVQHRLRPRTPAFIKLHFKMTLKELNDPKGLENIICTIMMYGEMLYATTLHTTSCSKDIYKF